MTEVEEFLRSALIQTRNDTLEEAENILENGKIDMNKPENFMTAIVNEDMAVSAFPKAINDALDHSINKLHSLRIS